MRAALAGLLLAFLPGAVGAFSIRSGEHDGFSRLVLQFDETPVWSLEPDSSGYVLRAQGIPRGLDISGVFRLIPRTRLADIRQDETTGHLQFDVACECHAEVFELDGRRIVIDFKPGLDPDLAARADKEPAATEALEITTDETIATETDEVTVLSSAEALPAQIDTGSPVATGRDGAQETRGRTPVSAALPREFGPPGTTRPRSSGPGINLEISDQPTVLPAMDRLEARPDGPSVNIGGFEQELARTLARAMTGGLVETPILPRIEMPVVQTPAENVKPSPSGERRGTSAAAPVPQERNHQARTQIEIDHAGRLDSAGSNPLRQCDGAVLPVFLLKEEESYDSLSTYRAAILDPGGRVIPEALEELVLFYLRQGFGTETRQLLSHPGFDPADEPSYLTVSHIVEGGVPASATLFSGQLTCGGEGALWEVLTSEQLPAFTARMRTTVARGFLLLPPGMKRAVGQNLTTRLIDHGESRLAKTIHAQLERSTRSAHSYGIARAELALVDGDHDRARAALLIEIASNSVASPEALLLLLEKTAEISLSEEELERMLVIADAYAFEHRGSSLETRLKRVTLHRRAQAGDLGSALKSMKTLGLTDDVERRALLADLLRTGLPALDDYQLAVFLAKDLELLDYLETGDPVLESTLLRAADLGLPGLTALLLRNFPETGPVLRAELQASVALDRRDETQMAAAIHKVSSESRTVLESRLNIRRRLPARPNKSQEVARPIAPADTTGDTVEQQRLDGVPVAPDAEPVVVDPDSSFEGSASALRGSGETLDQLNRHFEESDAATSRRN